MKKLTGSLPFRLLLGVVIGILVGQFASEGLLNIVVTLKYIMNQIISFCVPLLDLSRRPLQNWEITHPRCLGSQL